MKYFYIFLLVFFPVCVSSHPLTIGDIYRIARVFDLPPAALIGILATEKGRPGEARQNINGSWDMGPFQINTCHVDEIIRLGYAPQEIMMDPRLNAIFAARLLQKHYLRTNNIWLAIGAYHSRTPALQQEYILRVQSKLKNLDLEQLFFSINKKGMKNDKQKRI